MKWPPKETGARTGNRGRGKTSTVDSVCYSEVSRNYVGLAVLVFRAVARQTRG